MKLHRIGARWEMKTPIKCGNNDCIFYVVGTSFPVKSPPELMKTVLLEKINKIRD